MATLPNPKGKTQRAQWSTTRAFSMFPVLAMVAVTTTSIKVPNTRDVYLVGCGAIGRG